MDKIELLKYIGSVEQVGGISDFTYNDGKSKGVRGIEIDTGVIRFIILIDRCMDISKAFYKGIPISWISKTGITSPYYYKKDGKEMLRGFFGGLVTTCGLKNIGQPTETQGLHGRISNIPAEKISIFADWIENEYIMKVSGLIRESAVFGENLVLKRTITTKLFSDEFTLEDIVINEGFEEEKMAICYHCNFGYPLVCENAKIVNVPQKHSLISPPGHCKSEECIRVEYKNEEETVGIENGDIGVYITYKRNTLPDFLIWKMTGESEFVVGLEPRTTYLGGENIAKNSKYIFLKPFEEYKTKLKFKFKSI